MLRRLSLSTRGRATILAVWRAIHLLRPVPSFIVASASSAIFALPFALISAAHDETVTFRDLFWPHQFNPFLTFVLVFLMLLPVLLAYYHLGRVGVMVSIAGSLATGVVMALSALLLTSRPVWLGAFAYVGIGLVVYLFLLFAHMKAAKSRSIADAQRILRLVPSLSNQ